MEVVVWENEMEERIMGNFQVTAPIRKRREAHSSGQRGGALSVNSSIKSLEGRHTELGWHAHLKGTQCLEGV